MNGHVEISPIIEPRPFQMRVIDNGCGIDLKLVESRKNSHFGLSIMQERAERIGSTVRVGAADPALYPHGTCVQLTVPGTGMPEKDAV